MKLAYRDEYQKIWNIQGRKGPLSLYNFDTFNDYETISHILKDQNN
jgi:hypothetical protein